MIPGSLDRYHRARSQELQEIWWVQNHEKQNSVSEKRYPEGFALSRTREIILCLDQQRREVVHLLVSRFPGVRVEQIALVGIALGWGCGRFQRD
jgi:hypothetical protein